MTYYEFLKYIDTIHRMIEFEDKLADIGCEYPAGSYEMANLLEMCVTGMFVDDGLIAWWLYVLDSGKREGELTCMNGDVLRVKAVDDLWDILSNKDVYGNICELANSLCDQLSIDELNK